MQPPRVTLHSPQFNSTRTRINFASATGNAPAEVTQVRTLGLALHSEYPSSSLEKILIFFCFLEINFPALKYVLKYVYFIFVLFLVTLPIPMKIQ